MKKIDSALEEIKLLDVQRIQAIKDRIKNNLADVISSEGEMANVPTGFTPNGDGINDIFKPLGSAEFATEYQMTIWNRWGQEVFRSTDPLVGWDGNYKGAQALTGVYAYWISYKNIIVTGKQIGRAHV